MNNLKIGFIGCGKHAKANIYPSLAALGVKIQSVCAKHLDNAKSTALQFHIANAYDDHNKMLKNENLDAVFIVLPEALHPKIVIDCLRAGSHVFVEKPLGLTASDAQEVANISAKTGKHVMVGFMKRYSPAYIAAKNIIEYKEKFGEVLSLTGKFAARPFGSEEFYLKNAAIHYIDLIRFLVGEIKDVHGFSNSRDSYIHTAFSFSCKNGQIGSMLFSGTPSWSRHSEDVLVTGVNGFVKVDNMREVTYHFEEKEYKPSSPRWQLLDEKDVVLSSVDTSSSGGLKDLYLNGYVGEIKHFIECLSSGKAPNPSALDNVKTMEFCEKILSTIKHL